MLGQYLSINQVQTLDMSTVTGSRIPSDGYSAAVLCEEQNRGKLALFAGIDDVRFKRIVRPGDELTLTCDLETVRGPIGRGKARATVGGELAVRGTLTFAVGQS